MRAEADKGPPEGFGWMDVGQQRLMPGDVPLEFVHEGRVDSCSLVPLDPLDPGEPVPIGDPIEPIVMIRP